MDNYEQWRKHNAELQVIRASERARIRQETAEEIFRELMSVNYQCGKHNNYHYCPNCDNTMIVALTQNAYEALKSRYLKAEPVPTIPNSRIVQPQMMHCEKWRECDDKDCSVKKPHKLGWPCPAQCGRTGAVCIPVEDSD